MNALIAIFTNPRAVFDDQHEDPSWVAPALVILAFTVISAVAVTFLIDIEEVARAQLEQSIEMMELQGTPQAEIDNMRAASEQSLPVFGNPVVVAGIAVVSAVVGFFIVVLIHALYFMVVGKVMKTGHDFSDWFALSVWGRMPLVIAAIVTTIAAFVMSAQADVAAYNLLAFSTWMDLPNENHMYFSDFVKSLDLMVIWSIVILTIGFKSWTDKSMGVSLAVVAVPYVVIYALLMLL